MSKPESISLASLSFKHRNLCAPTDFLYSLNLLVRLMFHRATDNSSKIFNSCGQHSEKRPCVLTVGQPRHYATWFELPSGIPPHQCQWQTSLYVRGESAFVRCCFAVPFGPRFYWTYLFVCLYLLWSPHCIQGYTHSVYSMAIQDFLHHKCPSQPKYKILLCSSIWGFCFTTSSKLWQQKHKLI